MSVTFQVQAKAPGRFDVSMATLARSLVRVAIARVTDKAALTVKAIAADLQISEERCVNLLNALGETDSVKRIILHERRRRLGLNGPRQRDAD